MKVSSVTLSEMNVNFICSSETLCRLVIVCKSFENQTNKENGAETRYTYKYIYIMSYNLRKPSSRG